MEQSPKTGKKPAKKWVIGGSIFAVLAVFWAIGTFADLEEPSAKPSASAAQPKAAETEEPTPTKVKKAEAAEAPQPEKVTTPAERESPKEEKPASKLAAEVEAGILENFPGGMTPSTPLYLVSQYEDVSSGTIRVHVQEELTKDERATIARHVFNMGAYDNADLKTVVVRDTTGKDSNHYR